jgi:transposase
LILLLTKGQVSDYRGAATMLPSLPDASVLIADRGYDGDWFREALSNREIEPCIPGRKNRKEPVEYDTETYRQRNRVERMFCRLKGWRRIAATVTFWL